jgi:hypothetical protein
MILLDRRRRSVVRNNGWAYEKSYDGLLSGMAGQTLTLTLSDDDASRLSRIMRSGGYESVEAAVADALSALEDARDPAADAWLREVVAARFDACRSDPSQGVPLDEARRRLLGDG